MKKFTQRIENLRTTAFAATACVAMLATPTTASAHDYVFISYGYADMSDSDNSGSFPGGFVTGTGTTVPAGTELPAGASVGWNTELDSGDAISIGYGRDFNDFWRGEIEYSSQDNDVERHSGVIVGDGLAIDSEDAAILITGSDRLGASVGAIVGDARGNIEADYIMLNLYYDFASDQTFSPFLGFGIGYVDADITFNPSNVSIVDDSDSGVAYQVSAGGIYELTNELNLVGKLQYRTSDDFEVSTALFPATLEIENTTTSLNVGLQYKF